MSGSDSPADAADAGGPSAGGSPISPPRHRSPALRLTVVRRDGGTDRATVHPAETTGIERMETWLSVDLSAVSDLSAWR
jgi:hypothetical protein